MSLGNAASFMYNEIAWPLLRSGRALLRPNFSGTWFNNSPMCAQVMTKGGG